MAVCFGLLASGCVSNRYRMVKASRAVPPVPLERAFPAAPLQVKLQALITYHGPGSWKRDALWDEYVIFVANPGPDPVVLTGVVLLDHERHPVEPGADPWLLEKQSMTREQRYKATGIAFVRYTTPGVVLLGTGVAIAGASVGMGGISTGAATAATATVIALPIYYLAVISINHDNKKDVQAEFKKRRLQSPMQFGPGASYTGSLFFPMVVSPRELKVTWRRGQETGETILDLAFLAGLHVATPAASAN